MTESEYEKFDQTMKKLMRVPHEKIKAKLEAEKKAKSEAKDKKRVGKT